MKKIFLGLIMIGVTACSQNDVDKKDPDSNGKVEVEYADKILVAEGSAESVIADADEEGGIYTLKKSAFKKQPAVGEVILVPGEMMRKVTSIQSSGNNYVVETEMVPLTEVVKNGSFSFDIEPEWNDASSLRINGKEVLKEGQRIGLEPITAKLDVGNITHNITITPEYVDGKINSCKIELLMFSLNGSTSWKVVGTAKLPRQKTNIEIKNGELKGFSTENEGLQANFELSMATAGGSTGATSLKLPNIAIKIPLKVIPSPAGPIPNPIPMSLVVGMQLVTDITVLDDISSATSSSSVNYNASGGFKMAGSSIDATGGLNSGDITSGSFDSGANIGIPVDLQFGIAFPRIGFDIAGQEVAYVHVGYTTGSRLNWNGFEVCKSGYSKVIVEGGYSLSILGQTLLSGKKIFKEMEKKAGKDC